MNNVYDVEKALKDIQVNLAINGLDDEVAVFSLGGGMWRVEACNEDPCVMLGESSGRYRGEGKTIEEAIKNMRENDWSYDAECFDDDE